MRGGGSGSGSGSGSIDVCGAHEAACLLNRSCSPQPLTLLPPHRCSRRVNSVQRLRHSLLRADRLLEKHEEEVGGRMWSESSSAGRVAKQCHIWLPILWQFLDRPQLFCCRSPSPQ